MNSSAAMRERGPDGIDDFDRDSLHTLPLSMIPFETSGVRRSRMIKNTRYESVVELFKDKSTGSGQTHVDKISTVFKDIVENDVEILRKLQALASYDVYSLRILLRDMQIPVNDYAELCLSESKTRDLDDYMKQLTRPLIMQIFGADDTITEFADIISLFRQPDVTKAREKLGLLAEKLEVTLWHIPQFLQDCGDTYLSVSYYHQCFDHIQPLASEFRNSLEELVRHPQLRQDREFVQQCTRIQEIIERVNAIIDQRFQVFDQSAQDMWSDISAERFKTVEQLILGSRAMLGAMLCGLSVCLDGWSEKFPTESAGGPFRRAEYIRNEMRFAVENIRSIKVTSPKVAI